MKRTEANDLIMKALFSAYQSQGIKTERMEKIYERQRTVIEAEEIARGEFDGYNERLY
jgi:hypothetical protein